MNKHFNLKASLVVAAVLALSVAQAETITKVDYQAGKTRISADFKADKAACASLTANAKDVCVEEAKAKEKVARAELEYAYTAKPKDQTKVAVAMAESAYAVAKEKCDDLKDNAKDVCVKEAKAIEVTALADAKMGKKIGEAKVDAAEVKTDANATLGKKVDEAKVDATQAKADANYKLAAEKCDALAGDAKASCMATAKAKFGKN